MAALATPRARFLPKTSPYSLVHISAVERNGSTDDATYPVSSETSLYSVVHISGVERNGCTSDATCSVSSETSPYSLVHISAVERNGSTSDATCSVSSETSPCSLVHISAVEKNGSTSDATCSVSSRVHVVSGWRAGVRLGQHELCGHSPDACPAPALQYQEERVCQHPHSAQGNDDI
jgi:hypothetical protein